MMNNSNVSRFFINNDAVIWEESCNREALACMVCWADRIPRIQQGYRAPVMLPPHRVS